MKRIEGSIGINLHTALDGGGLIEIDSTRPLHVTKVLLGKHAEEALDIIPLLFNVCAVAQARAAFMCLREQVGWSTDHQIESGHEVLVWVETAKEHLLRIFLDWPGLLNIENRHGNPSYIVNLVGVFKTALFKTVQPFSPNAERRENLQAAYDQVDSLEQYLENEVFCSGLEDWLSICDAGKMRAWSQRADSLAAQATWFIFKNGWTDQGATTCQRLPELSPDILFERLSAKNTDEFIARPKWLGSCHETGAFSRQFDQPLTRLIRVESGNGLLGRWTARLEELAEIPARLRRLLAGTASNHDFSTSATRQSHTLAQVEAARGRLVHCVDFDQDRIRDYRILAPTEWNFHPEGVICEALRRLRVDNKADRDLLARLMINMIDPCVAYTLRIDDA